MPKFTKSFGRRKVTAPPEELLDGPAPVVESSFKVFDRAERASKNFDGGAKYSRAPPKPGGRPTIVQVEDDNLFENMSRSNHSGSSNKLTSTTNTSSRLSATSTASSVPDNYNGHEWSSPHDKPFTDIPPPPVPRSSTGFTLKSAGRAMSWGKQKSVTSKELPPSPSTVSGDEETNRRSRAVTTSSYASTTVLPRHDEKDLNLGLGGDFSDMFSGFGKRSPSPAVNPETRGKYSDSFSVAPSTRAYPGPLNLEKSKGSDIAPCTSGGQRSTEGLLSGASPPPAASTNSPNLPHSSHQEIRAVSPVSSTTSSVKSFRTSDDAGKRSSMNRGRKKTIDSQKIPSGKDIKPPRDSENLGRRRNEPSDKIRENWAASVPPQKTDNLPRTRWAPEHLDTVPQGNAAERKLSDENMFDSTIVARANLAQRFQERPVSPLRSQTMPTKVMTPAQFERYKQDQERLRAIRGKTQDDGDDDNEAYDDDEDDIEKAKAVAKQRRKQEAHMAVYRQQMMKVIGETSGPSSDRPSMFTSQSSPNLANLGLPEENEEEDEEVPLGILQAHGFPSKNKPPMRTAGSNPNLKSAANIAAGNVADPRLPVFARNLPHDPYYGSGIVNPIQRESLAFSGGSSASSGAGRGLPPGGLVGVIATEERSRAMRRGSPNPQGEFPSQLPSNNIGASQILLGPSNNIYGGMNPPPGSLLNPIGPPSGSLLNPTVPPPGSLLNPIPPSMIATPNQAQLQMTQQMNQFMQMQMNFMQMMAQGGQQVTQPSQPIPPEISRPASAQMHQRSLTMMNQNSSPWLNRISVYAPSVHGGNGYAASIAPSERSNIGLPGRYRPVSQLPIPTQEKPRASSMCVSLQNWDNKINTGASTSIKVVNSNVTSGNISDEDEDEAWANLAKKKNERKSIWKTKKERESNGLKEMLGYSS